MTNYLCGGIDMSFTDNFRTLKGLHGRMMPVTGRKGSGDSV